MEEPEVPPPAGSPPPEGDWTCEECGNVNFARRTACNRCAKPPPAAVTAARKRKLGHEIGKAAAEKSRGLFSADDWQCNKCGNVNWARRQQCNVCNAPKFGDVEERTGLGGGYNDRGVVEYREQEESDGEYDEFGRKKQKRRRAEGGEDEEEEEEEEDDDGDLSKYDLSEWGAEEGGGVEEKARSRSPIDKKVHSNQN